jgi:hypothetical protein
MFSSLRHLVGWIFSAFGSRQDLVLENLALRQQLLAFYQATAADYPPGTSCFGSS